MMNAATFPATPPCEVEAMIASAERSGCWPVEVESAPVIALSMSAGEIGAHNAAAIVGHYSAASDKAPMVLGINGGRYQATTAEEWRTLLRAAAAAGARPVGGFNVPDGSRPVALFDVGQVGTRDGLTTRVVIGDSYNGTSALTGGGTVNRNACANVIASAHGSRESAAWAKVRHTSSLSERIEALSEAIALAMASGETVRETYAAARERRLTTEDTREIIARLFPVPEEPGRSRTIAENLRTDAVHAMDRPENAEGPTLATVWNAATWTVDRHPNGAARATRGDARTSMLFGSRGKRVEVVRRMIEVVLADGSVEEVEEGSPLEVEALASTGRALIDSMF